MHTYKIGEWFQLGILRYLVYRVDSNGYWGVGLSGESVLCAWTDRQPKHLPDCTGWDWQPTPREWWINEYEKRNGSVSVVIHATSELAEKCAGGNRLRCTRVREVIE